MSGRLDFTLGLATGGFLASCRQASSGFSGLIAAGLRFPVIGAAVGSVVGSLTSLHSIVEGVFGVFEKGAGLEHLSRRLNESVPTLYKFEKGLKACGVPAESLSPLI